MRSAVLLLALALGGCATCYEHQRGCAVAAVIAGVCLGLAVNSRKASQPDRSGVIVIPPGAR